MSDTPDWAEQLVAGLLPCAIEIGRSDICAGPENRGELTPHIADCPAWYRQRVAQALREAEQRGYRAGIEAAAKIADGWATSKTCRSDGEACEHNRTGGGIADAIRALAEKEQP